jgi:hypothetical protein
MGKVLGYRFVYLAALGLRYCWDCKKVKPTGEPFRKRLRAAKAVTGNECASSRKEEATKKQSGTILINKHGCLAP